MHSRVVGLGLGGNLVELLFQNYASTLLYGKNIHLIQCKILFFVH